MNEHAAYPLKQENAGNFAPLLDRMDPAIGEASSVMGAMVTELIRRSLRGGVLQLGQELHGYVTEKVDATIVEHTPVMEQIAADVAENTARQAATEVAKEEIHVLEERTKESDAQLAAQIEEAEKHSETRVEEAARTLSTAIEEAERRATETARAELTQQMEVLLEKSRGTASTLKKRLQMLETRIRSLGRQLLDEEKHRQAEYAALQAQLEQEKTTFARELEHTWSTLCAELEQERTARQAGEQAVRDELLRALEEKNARLREEVATLRQTNETLTTRVVELEKPRGLRWLLGKLLFWRK